MRERERIAAQVAGMRARADELDAAANVTSEGLVPEHGQPILVGHHSERAHRRMMDRASARWSRQAEQAKEAEQLRRNATATEAKNAAAIYDDDPDAVERLEREIAGHEREIVALRADAWHKARPEVLRDAVASTRRVIRRKKKRAERLAGDNNLNTNEEGR